MLSIERATEHRQTTLLDLPDELILQLFYDISPEDTVHFGLTNHRLHQISNTDLLWRHHSLTTYKYWHPRHQVPHHDLALLADKHWKRLFDERKRSHHIQQRLFDNIIATQLRRYAVIGELATHGDDAKDFLLIHARDPKWLSKSYWANVVLGQIHRASGLAIWSRLISQQDNSRHIYHSPRSSHRRSPPPAEIDMSVAPVPATVAGSESSASQVTPLEQYLAVFDHFLTAGTSYERTAESISQMLDQLASQLISDIPLIWTLPAEERILSITTFMYEQGYRGVRNVEDYHNLQNNFLGLTLTDPNHEGLPLVYATIFCAIAVRLGLVAHPTNFPMHVHAVVTGITIAEGAHDINHHHPDHPPLLLDDPFYVNPFSPDPQQSIVHISHLHQLLREMGVPSVLFPGYLSPANPRALIIRTTRNIWHSLGVLANRRLPPDRLRLQRAADRQNRVPTYVDAINAFEWATILLGKGSRSEENSNSVLSREHCISNFANKLSELRPWDLCLIEQYMETIVSQSFHGEEYVLIDAMDEVREGDENLPTVKRRSSIAQGKVKYHIGQVFRHRRYGYLGVVRGWSVNCDASESWIRSMDVDNLDGGREQSFYHALVDVGSDRYVAEENIEIVHEKPPIEIMEAAGRYFHYYDEKYCCFVSNLKEEYPSG